MNNFFYKLIFYNHNVVFFYNKILKYPQEEKFSLQIQKMINILISIKNVERTHIDDSIEAFFLI